MQKAGQRRLQRLGMARNGLRTLAHLAPQLPALAALDAAGCRLADEAELGRLAELPALASVCLADTPLSRKPVCSPLYMGCWKYQLITLIMDHGLTAKSINSGCTRVVEIF